MEGSLELQMIMVQYFQPGQLGGKPYLLRGCLEGNVSSPIKENLGLIDVKNKLCQGCVFGALGE